MFKIWIRQLFCKHKWKILSETTTQSKYEHFTAVLGQPKDINVVFGALKRKYIQIVTCDECGKLKRFVEDI